MIIFTALDFISKLTYIDRLYSALNGPNCVAFGEMKLSVTTRMIQSGYSFQVSFSLKKLLNVLSLLGASACWKLNLSEEAISWCNEGLAVSFDLFY